jgi:type IV pilus assembly protein PilQ
MPTQAQARNAASLFMAALLLFLPSCAPHERKKTTAEKMLETPLMEKKQLVDRKRLIESGKKRNAEHASFGPNVLETKENDVRDRYNIRLNQEDPFDYTEIRDNTSGEHFPISLNVENMDIRSFIDVMAALSSNNFLVSDDVKGTVTAKLHEVQWDSALDSVLKIEGLAKHVDRDSGIIRIHKQEAVAQMEAFERQRRSEQQQAILLERASEPLFTDVFKLFYIKPAEAKSILQGVLGLNAGGGAAGGGAAAGMRDTTPQITMDERRNLLLVKARKDDLDLIKKVVAEIDARTRQVFIEAFIVEVTDDFARELGTRLGLTFQVGATDTVIGAEAGSLASAPTGAVNMQLGLVGGSNLKLELAAMEEEGLTRVVANPRIFTLDNKEAVIFQGDEVPYTTVSQEGTKTEFKQAGLKLLVTPTVIGDGNLQLDITLNKDTVNTAVENPPITKSEIQTSLVSKDGEIVVIGGIYTETESGSESKIPGLGDVPAAGRLFRKDGKSDIRKELMIFIAPRAI